MISNLGNQRQNYTQFIKVRESLVHGRSQDRARSHGHMSSNHRINFNKELLCKDNQTMKLSLLSVFIPITYYTIDQSNNKFMIQIKLADIRRQGSSTTDVDGQRAPYNQAAGEYGYSGTGNADVKQTGSDAIGIDKSMTTKNAPLVKARFRNNTLVGAVDEKLISFQAQGSLNHHDYVALTDTANINTVDPIFNGDGIYKFEIPIGNYTASTLAETMTDVVNREFNFTESTMPADSKQLRRIILDRHSVHLTDHEQKNWAALVYKQAGLSGSNRAALSTFLNKGLDSTGRMLGEFGNIPDGTNIGVADAKDVYRYLQIEPSQTIDDTFSKNLVNCFVTQGSGTTLLPESFIKTSGAVVLGTDASNQGTQTISAGDGGLNGPRVDGFVPKFRFYFDSTTGKMNLMRTDHGRLFIGGGFQIIFGPLGKLLGYNHLSEAAYNLEAASPTLFATCGDGETSLTNGNLANPFDLSQNRVGENDDEGKVVYRSQLYDVKAKYINGSSSDTDTDYHVSSTGAYLLNITSLNKVTALRMVNDETIDYYSQRIIAPGNCNIGRDTLFFRTNFKGIGYDSQTKDHSDILAVVPVSVVEGDKLFYEPINLLRTDIGKINRISYIDVKITDSEHKPINFRKGEFEYCLLVETFDIVSIPIHRDKSGEVNSQYSEQEAQNLTETQMVHTRMINPMHKKAPAYGIGHEQRFQRGRRRDGARRDPFTGI